MTTPGSGPIPDPGRIVMYHQREDGRDWPAIVLEVVMETGALVETDPPGTETYSCLLQVFRRGHNDWVRASEGTEFGQWSWPR